MSNTTCVRQIPIRWLFNELNRSFKNIFNNLSRLVQYDTRLNFIGFNDLCIPIDLTDCYDGLMNFSNPILICDENEEFRILIRDMLTKNGFFHVVEASSSDEAINFLQSRKDYFVLLTAEEASREIEPLLREQNNFIIFSNKKHEALIPLSVKFGINHIMTYPFHSRKLMEKINSLI